MKLPVEPMQKLVARKHLQYGSLALLSEITGVPARRLKDIEEGRAKYIREAEVDRFCTREQDSGYDYELYPQLAIEEVTT
jgi:hypothetical protein